MGASATRGSILTAPGLREALCRCLTSGKEIAFVTHSIPTNLLEISLKRRIRKVTHGFLREDDLDFEEETRIRVKTVVNRCGIIIAKTEELYINIPTVNTKKSTMVAYYQPFVNGQ